MCISGNLTFKITWNMANMIVPLTQNLEMALHHLHVLTFSFSHVLWEREYINIHTLQEV